MAMWLRCILIGIIGYLLGNISMGYLIGRLYGVKDIRAIGSGNAGSTNVLRSLGWVPSLLTLLGDALKAFLAAKIGQWIGGDLGLLIGGATAVLGHDFPAFMGFRGGKGIASCAGWIIAIDPIILPCLLVPFLIVVALTRYVSLGSVIVAALYPVVTYFLMRSNAHLTAYLIFSIGAGALAIFQHRKNIKRLLDHEENRLDFERIAKIRSKIGGLKRK